MLVWDILLKDSKYDVIYSIQYFDKSLGDILTFRLIFLISSHSQKTKTPNARSHSSENCGFNKCAILYEF